MSITFEAMLRLKALHERRAQVRVTHQQVRIAPDALILVPVKMAGEDVTIWAIGFGRRGRPMQFDFVADPRNRDREYGLFGRLGAVVADYYLECQILDRPPQVWVVSPAAVKLLDLLADRLRYGTDGPYAKPAAVITFGEHLTHLAQRWVIPGNHTLVAATNVLTTHFATGQQAADDQHLEAGLVWVDAPADEEEFWAALAVAETVPMGVLANPETDNDDLADRVEAWNVARRNGADDATLDRLARPIGAVLHMVIEPIYGAIGRTIDAVEALGLPELPTLADRWSDEAWAFRSFMSYLERPEHRFALRDRPLPAALGLLEREAATANCVAEGTIHDRGMRAEAKAAGTAFEARIAGHQSHIAAGVGPSGRRTSRQVHTLVLEAAEPDARIRRGDSFHWLAAPNFSVRIDAFRITPARTLQIEATVISGHRSPGVPAVGRRLELVSEVPDRWRLPKKRRKLRDRLANGLPWPQDRDQPAPAPAGAPHPDPLAVVERLRRPGRP